MTERVFSVFHLYCGIGGGAIGFQRARSRVGGLQGRFRTLGGVDIDPAACVDFRALTGVPALCADMAKVLPPQLRAAAGGETPDVIFTSPPCKGFSALLPKEISKREKYQALNRLVIQGLWLALETWQSPPPKLIVLENVPGIMKRGAELLVQLQSLLFRYGYRVTEGTHDCGKIGGLAQHRKRFLLVARHEAQVPAFMYHPPEQRVRAIGEVIGPMPMPDDERCGPMHRLSRLEWETWIKLARIPAGGDWRSLLETKPKDAAARKRWEQEGIKTEGETHLFKGKLGVMPFDKPSRTVIGGPSNGASVVADPRAFRTVYGVVPFTAPIGTVTANGRPGAGAFSVADPRPTKRRKKERPPRTCNPFNNVWRLVKWIEPAGAVTSGGGPSSSGTLVADPRVSENKHHAKMRVEDFDGPAHTITGSDRVGSGAPSLADPRLGLFGNHYRVSRWNGPAPTITSATRPVEGAIVVADDRIGNWVDRPGLMGVLPWGEAANAITGSATVTGGNCPAAVADPRVEEGWWGEPVEVDPEERPDPPPMIIAADGTWHRPLTTLELLALQGFPIWRDDGSVIVLHGRSHGAWRERIGNAVPPPAAQAIAEAMLDALLDAEGAFKLTTSDRIKWVHEQPTLSA